MFTQYSNGDTDLTIRYDDGSMHLFSRRGGQEFKVFMTAEEQASMATLLAEYGF